MRHKGSSSSYNNSTCGVQAGKFTEVKALNDNRVDFSQLTSTAFFSKYESEGGQNFSGCSVSIELVSDFRT